MDPQKRIELENKRRRMQKQYAAEEEQINASLSKILTEQAQTKDSIFEASNRIVQQAKTNQAILVIQKSLMEGIVDNQRTLTILKDKTIQAGKIEQGLDNQRLATAQAGYDLDIKKSLLHNKEFQTNALLQAKIQKTSELEQKIFDFQLKKSLENDKQYQKQEEMIRQMEKVEEYENTRIENLDKMYEIVQQMNDLASDPKVAATFFGTTMLNNAISYGNTMKDMAGDLGMSRDQMMGIAGELGPAAAKSFLMGVSAKELGEAYGGIQSTMGPMTDNLTDMADNAAHMAHRLKISGAEAGKLYALTNLMEGGTAETAEKSLEHVENLARGANVPIGKVMSDVANSADLIAEYGYDNVEALGKAAVEAAKMGTSLDQMAKTADKLMDIDNARNDAMQLSVMLGRNINIDRAQQLIYAGDLQGGYKEMLSQLGGIQGFNNMDYYQKKAAAQMMGVSTGELQKQLNLAAGLTESGEKHATGLAKISGIGLDYLGHMKENATTYASMLSIMKSMGGTKIFTALGKPFKAVGSKIASMVGIGKKAAAGPTKMDGSLDMRFKANKALKDMKPGTDQVQKINKPGPKGDNMIVSFFKGFSKVKWSGIFKAVVAMALMGVALIAFVPPFKMMAEIPVQGILAGLGTLVALAGTMQILGKQQSSIMKGAAGMFIMAAAMTPIAFAFQMIGGVPMDSMWNFAAVTGVLALAIAGIGLLGGLPIGAAGLLLMAISMVPIALAFQMVAGLPMGEMWNFTAILTVLGLVFSGIGYLAALPIGALGMLIMAPAMVIMAAAFMMVQGLPMGEMWNFVGVLSAIGLAVSLIGMFPTIFTGALGMLFMAPGIIGIALALSFTKGLDAATMLAFAGSIGLIGLAVAGIGLVSPLIMIGSLAMLMMIPGIIGIAMALSFTKGLDPLVMAGFATTVGLLAMTVAGFGIMLPFILLGSIGLLAMSGGLMAISMALGMIPVEFMQGGGMMEFSKGLGSMALVGLMLIPAAVGIAFFSIAIIGLATALYVLTPVIGTLALLVSLGGQIGALMGFGTEENEDGETTISANNVNLEGNVEGIGPAAEEATNLETMKELLTSTTDAKVGAAAGNTTNTLAGGGGGTENIQLLADAIVKKISTADFKVYLDGKKVNKALYNPAGT